MSKLNATYWEQRWQEQQTGWDIGEASPPLVRFLETVEDKQTRILIPGAGRSHEALYLYRNGYEQVYVCDWAASAFVDLKQAAPDFPEANLLIGDFFELAPDKPFELMLEQTFFCAIEPRLRPKYVQKAAELLEPGGTLAGVLFAREFPFAGPPFGGTEAAYREVFSSYFEIQELAITPYSVAPRAGNELFIKAVNTGRKMP